MPSLQKLFSRFLAKEQVKADWMIAGLGNPGFQYADNRHNIGWMVASALAEKHKQKIMPYSNFCNSTILKIHSKAVLVVQPTTFMNNSGKTVSQMARKFSVPIENIVVIVDEYNFPLGKLHLKDRGGDGGHNGVNSVIEHLDSESFLRLRCGIDRNFGEGELTDYVLSDFKNEELALRNKMIEDAVTSLEYLIRVGKSRAMSEINAGKAGG
ncbi:MAG: aminoacyl-tRNA hydrolase [Bacteroidota bacterium]|jgi:PTH1 family peptidyl-tRNA hydrolase